MKFTHEIYTYGIGTFSHMKFPHDTYTYETGTVSHMKFPHMNFPHIKLTHMELQPFHIWNFKFHINRLIQLYENLHNMKFGYSIKIQLMAKFCSITKTSLYSHAFSLFSFFLSKSPYTVSTHVSVYIIWWPYTL